MTVEGKKDLRGTILDVSKAITIHTDEGRVKGYKENGVAHFYDRPYRGGYDWDDKVNEQLHDVERIEFCSCRKNDNRMYHSGVCTHVFQYARDKDKVRKIYTSRGVRNRADLTDCEDYLVGLL